MPNNSVLIGVPLLLGGLASAGWWIWRQRRANAGLAPSLRTSAPDLADREFEAVVVQAFQRQGYQLIDGGKGIRALTLRRDRETYLVQCRHRHVAKVGVDAVQALHREMTACGANGGFMLTEGRFSREATALAASCNVRLLEGSALHGLLESTRPKRHGA
ncbi:restriction endonuclease [Rhizobacter sp. Root404]|uniref:restriction endonuclease n=1 Tax=Rhizobacter sp. Root404 TaxID=1736528 RepID=UPI000701A502|nr:restriction endonuclease [Rhizobacter sp. Root404]KQW36435.1 hypothetical protein ASC76_17285 [Rhizobacter sp. Root404]